MGTSLDFNSTAGFRNSILSRNLPKAYGIGGTLPSQFTASSYELQNLSNFPVIPGESIDDREETDLKNNIVKNKYQPNQYEAYSNVNDLTQDLSSRGLYPLFSSQDYSLFQLLNNQINTNLDSDLLKTNTENLKRVFKENFSQENLFNQSLFKITPDQLDLNALINGSQQPIPNLPGTYLTNPVKRLSPLGIVDDLLRVNLGSPINPSNIMVQYMGEGQRSLLFENLSYSRYIPDYTFFAPGAPLGNSYIGGLNFLIDPIYTMSDFRGNWVYSNYYLTQAFGEFIGSQAKMDMKLEGDGDITGGFTWKSPSIRNPLGQNNQQWNKVRSSLENSLSTNYEFRSGSILDKTQELLDLAPKGGAGRTHIGNAIDQTSRVFREGDKMISKGAAVKFVDKFNGTESGMEYCRVWTKDTPYSHFSDTMKTGGNNRKFTYSVLDSPFNLNIAPVNGNNNFEGSTNIISSGNGFQVKKYMFSIENLAWKSSHRYGFRYEDLPDCEKGANGGRIMWFPPYALQVNENNSSKWNDNNFLGRVEPVYTYSGAERSGTLTFKIVVDHPSVLNLLTRKRFNGMSDAEVNNYIHAFFAGCENVDIYDLTRKYTTLDKDDIERILAYLNGSNNTTEVLTVYKQAVPTQINNVIQTGDFNKVSNTSTEDSYLYFDYNLGVDDYEDQYNVYVNTDSKNLYLKMFQDGAAAISMSPTDITNNTNSINQAFTTLSSNFTNIDKTVSTAANGIKNGDLISIFIGTGRATNESDTISSQRITSIKKYILKKLGITYEDKDKFEVEYIIDDNTKGTTTVSFTTTDYATAFNNDINGISCAGNSLDLKSKNNNLLKQTLPQSFYCRAAHVKITVNQRNPLEKSVAIIDSRTIPGETTAQQITVNTSIPTVDEVKRILMKLLSENYYFDVMKEDTPLIFSSLKEKLKYFHPGFHSTTPEGLNSRLTFLLQCTRPGDTIPIIHSDGEETFSDARNTTFGAPPVCILRIGDFYNSKVIIRDVNISYEDSPWDMNPEGIGLQPMIADVTMSFFFIGGHGLKEPVSELQNALSSNFYANTEMYDYRSTATEDRSKFNKEFLHSLLESSAQVTTKDLNNKLKENFGEPIGKIIQYDIDSSNLASGKLNYTDLVNTTIGQLNDYGQIVTNYFNTVYKKYGKTIATIMLGTVNRSYISGTFIGQAMNLVGIHNPLSSELDTIVTNVSNDISEMNFDVFLKIKNILTDSQYQIYKTNYNTKIKLDLFNTLLLKMKTDFNNNESSLIPVERELINNIDKINFVNFSADGLINKDGIRDFTLSRDSGGVLTEFFKDQIPLMNNFYTNLQNKFKIFIQFQIENNKIEDISFRPNILANYFDDIKLNAYLDLFGDIGASKRTKISELLKNYFNSIKIETLDPPKILNKTNRTIETTFTENALKPNETLIRKIFNTTNQSNGTSYNYSKLLL